MAKILVKIIEDAIAQFPYSLTALRLEYPDVSFPYEPSEAILNSYNAYTVKYYPYPVHDPRTQIVKASNLPVLIDGIWSIKHEVIDKTEEEIQSHDDSELKTLRTRILSEIDNKTNELIIYGFIYTGLKVRLTIEDQINFEGEFNLIKDFMSNGTPEAAFFPVNYKVWTNEDGSPIFMSLNNLNELREFLFMGKTYIRDCLAAGWVIKDAVINMTIAELKSWKDSRIEE